MRGLGAALFLRFSKKSDLVRLESDLVRLESDLVRFMGNEKAKNKSSIVEEVGP